MIKSRLPVCLPILTVMSFRRSVSEGVTVTQTMSCRPKTHPQDWTTRRTSMGTSDKWKQGLEGWYWRHLPTNSAFPPHQRAQNLGACQRQEQPAWKPPRQWHRAAGQHPATPGALTPVRHISNLGQASAMTPRWGWICRSTSMCMRPPGYPPSRSRLHDLWGLPGLGAPISSRTIGWRIHRG